MPVFVNFDFSVIEIIHWYFKKISYSFKFS
nr:MAG TPA: hypothetical protein [Bacteriophage sp.]